MMRLETLRAVGSGKGLIGVKFHIPTFVVNVKEQRCLDDPSIDDQCTIDSLPSSFTSALTPANAIMAQPNCSIPRHTLSDGALTAVVISVVFSRLP